MAHPFFERVSLSTLDLGFLCGVAVLLVAAAEWMGALTDAIPSVLWLSTLALLTGHLLPVARTVGSMQLGNYALHLFFVVIGIQSRVTEIIAVGPVVLYFLLVAVIIHAVFVFGGGRILRQDLRTLGVASLACIGGPSTALAVAVAGGRRNLVLPGIAVGLLGYALGNYLGFSIAHLLRTILTAT